ncbi:YgjV family protein [Paraferrimonas sp. SM1919]|uniref:YgjV family protein n=1 Tax=Paraferrimonas sp. SM1919 TaxID=2662263 RepID=UPI0013D315A2|nr:YgjV family protein [Paraferrimonas sp. SM1919]
MTIKLFLAQTLGFVSLALGLWASKQTSDSKLLQGNLAASFITAIHFGLLGSLVAMLNQLLNLGRFSLCQSYKHKLLAWIFSAGAMLIGWHFCQYYYEWLAVIASVILSFGLFYANGTALRKLMLIAALVNLCLAIFLNSYSGMLYQLLSSYLLASQIGLLGQFKTLYYRGLQVTYSSY